MPYATGLMLLFLLISSACLAEESAQPERPILNGIREEGRAIADTVIIAPAERLINTTNDVIDATKEEGRKLKKDVQQRLEDRRQPQIQLTINGIKGALLRNVEAHLQPLPTTTAERASYLFTLEQKINDGLQALGYYQSQISTSLEQKERWQLTINIVAGEPVRYRSIAVIIDGEGKDDPELMKLQQHQAIKLNDVVNHGLYEQLKSQLISTGLLRGYFDGAMVEQRLAIDRQANQAELLLHYDSRQRYRLGKVNFSGSDLDPELLQSLVPFNEGQLYHNDEISKLTGDLTSVGYFSEVKVLPQPGAGRDNTVPIEVSLAPAPRHSFEVGVGYATDTQERMSVTWRTPKVNRYGHSQETRLEISRVNPELAFNYRIPLHHPINDQLQLGASYGREPYGDLDSTQTQANIGRQTVLENSWTRRYFVRYLNEDWQQAGNDIIADYILPGISFSRTRRRGPALDPTDGFSQFYLLEHGLPLGSEAEQTTRFRGQLRWVDTPWTGHRFVTRLDLGFNNISDDQTARLAPSLRFFAGGDQTVRGFAYQSLAPTIEFDGNTQIIGGRYMSAASIEYQYYFSDKWRVAMFTDAGNAFNERDSKDIDWAYSVGLGLHWISPIGPIKFDVGYGISEESPPIRLHVTIGSEL